MEEKRYIRLGQVKQKAMQYEFDGIYEKYKEKAKKLGYSDKLIFIVEHGKVLIYTEGL